MQTRDYYLHDYTMKYYPKIDKDTFVEDIKDWRLDTIVFDEADAKFDSDLLNSQNISIKASLGVGLLTILAYNKIPIINRCQARWKKFFFKSVLMFMPAFISVIYSGGQHDQFFGQIYLKHFDKYVKFKQNGDLKILNPQVKLIDE